MRDDLGALEELIPPDVVSVFVRVDHAPRHARPMTSVMLGVSAPG
jgi:hypothetical protein